MFLLRLPVDIERMLKEKYFVPKVGVDAAEVWYLPVHAYLPRPGVVSSPVTRPGGRGDHRRVDLDPLLRPARGRLQRRGAGTLRVGLRGRHLAT